MPVVFVGLSLASALGGLGTGVVLGSAQPLWPADVSGLVAITLVPAGVVEVAGRARWWLRVGRETPRHWHGASDSAWAWRTGLALGAGVLTRWGFGLWLVIILGAGLVSSPAIPVVAMSAYGLLRGVLALGVAQWYQRDDPAQIGAFLLNLRPFAARLSGVMTIVFGSVIIASLIA
jgi:hypothetical protein